MPQQELRLKNYLEYCSKIGYGMTRNDLANMVQYVLKKAEEEGFPQDSIHFVDLRVLYDCLVNHMTSHKHLSY